MDYTVKLKIKGKSDSGIFDQMDKLPDMSLKELYYVIKGLTQENQREDSQRGWTQYGLSTGKQVNSIKI